jgi:hypothetical protein
MLALKLQREVERRLATVFGTTDADRYAVTVPDALAALSRLTLLHYKVYDKIAVQSCPCPTNSSSAFSMRSKSPCPPSRL